MSRSPSRFATALAVGYVLLQGAVSLSTINHAEPIANILQDVYFCLER
jgi:hypothetical protein